MKRTNLLLRMVLITVAVAAMGRYATLCVFAEESPSAEVVLAQNAPVKAFMRKKLVAAEQILEGLTSPDPALIRKGATTMIHMSKEAMWVSHRSPSYAQDSADFVRTAERLVKLTNAGDTEGASHTYAQLTIQCVSCHRRVRSQKVAARSLPAGPEPSEVLATNEF